MKLHEKYLISEKPKLRKSEILELKPFEDVYQKAKRVVKSSKTAEQLEVAKQYFKTFMKLYSNTMSRAIRSRVAKGTFMEMTALYKDKEKELGIKSEDWYDRYLKVISKDK